jgi:hypothetical protein
MCKQVSKVHADEAYLPDIGKYGPAGGPHRTFEGPLAARQSMKIRIAVMHTTFALIPFLQCIPFPA